MQRHVYWQAPLWEVALALAGLAAALFWLARRALRRPSAADALAALDPGLAEAVLFHFHPAQGLTPLGGGARRLLAGWAAQHDERGLEAALVAAMVRAAERGERVQVEAWPAEGSRLVALGLPRPGPDLGRAIAAVVTSGDPVTALAPRPAEAEEGAWQVVGPELRVHRRQPETELRRPGAAGQPASWRRHALAYAEDRLLRALLASSGQVVPAERLFGEVWPEESVGRHGLRPDQRDRLRRLVFQLRQHVEPAPAEPRLLRTAHGIGYALYAEGGDGPAPEGG